LEEKGGEGQRRMERERKGGKKEAKEDEYGKRQEEVSCRKG
jgi:hypothetical protein